MPHIEELKEENKRLRHTVRHVLLKTWYYFYGFLMFFVFLFVVISSVSLAFGKELFSLWLGIAVGMTGAAILFIAVMRFITGHYKEELGFQNLKTFDYEKEDEIFNKITPEEIIKEEYGISRFYLVYLAAAFILILINIFYFRFKGFNSNILPFLVFLPQSLLFIYIAAKEKYYILDKFQPNAILRKKKKRTFLSWY